MPIDPSAMTLTFEDEFDGTGLGTSTWMTRYWWGGRSLATNGEKQYFADASTDVIKTHPDAYPFRIEADPNDPGDGVLTITAAPSPDKGLTEGLDYVSGLINTFGSFSQLYGYFEIRVDLPDGQGLWPAFWMLPADGSWPPEIDIMEFLGRDPSTYHASMHWENPSTPWHDYTSEAIVPGHDLSDGFNTFGCLWVEGSLTFTLNGEDVFTMATPDGFDVPMYLLAGLAVGGTWGGDPDETTVFPAEMRIDWIRAWSFGAAPPENRIIGSSGADVLEGTSGDDVIFGRGGRDKLRGGDGDDILAGGPGDDRLYGGAGSDTADYSDAEAGVVACLDSPRKNRGDADGDRYVSIENLRGSAHADTLTGDGTANRLAGGAGDDCLQGGSGDDVLEGGGGNDLLDGGKGSDRLHGGHGADRFVFRTVDEIGRPGRGDVILDFSGAEGDRIDLSAIDANATTRRPDDFVYIGDTDFSGTASQLRCMLGPDGVYHVMGDTNGDGHADFDLLVYAQVPLVMEHFLF